MSGKALNKTFKQSKSQRAPSSAKKDKAAPVQRSGVHKSTASKPAAGPTPEEAEQLLRTFDLTSKYGPCTGMTRLERWERSHKFGLDPPLDVKQLLEASAPSANQNVWAGRT